MVSGEGEAEGKMVKCLFNDKGPHFFPKVEDFGGSRDLLIYEPGIF